MTPHRPPLTTLLGRPHAVRLRDHLTVAVVVLFASSALSGVIDGRSWSSRIMSILMLCMACGWLAAMFTSTAPGSFGTRLREFAGRLCLRCGRECTLAGENVECAACGISVRGEYLYDRWGWLTPSPPGADETRRITVYLRPSDPRGDSKNESKAIVGMMLLLSALLLLPLGFLFESKAFLPSILLGLWGLGLMSGGDTSKSMATLREKRECLGCGYSLEGLDDWRCPECGLRVIWEESQPPKPPPRCPRGVQICFLLTLAGLVTCGAGLFVAMNAYNSAEWNGQLAAVDSRVPLRSTKLIREDMESRQTWRAEALDQIAQGDWWIRRVSLQAAAVTLVSWITFTIWATRARNARERDAYAASMVSSYAVGSVT